MTASRIFTVFAAAVLLAGCLPIELDVSGDGKVLIPRAEGYFTLDPASGKVERIYGDDGGKPAFALFMPDGKSIIAINEAGDGGGMSMGMGQNFNVQHVELEDGGVRGIYSGANLTYAAVSPDGAILAITQVAGEKSGDIDENLPELLLIDIQKGSQKKVASNAAPLVRWFPDSKAVLAYKIDSKDSEKNTYTGSMVKISAAGESEPRATVISGKDMILELSPDGSKALFTAIAIGGAKAEEQKEAEEPALFELDIASGESRRVSDAVAFAVYSPDGKRVLLGTGKKNDRVTLSVADAASPGEATAIAEGVATGVGSGMGPSTSIYPGWIDNETIVYLASRPAYGIAGVNLHLVTVPAKGGGELTDHQSAIDAAALE